MVQSNDIISDVSRETHERMDVYVDILKKWNTKINLVSRSTIPDIWHRHIQDSVQVFQSFPLDKGLWLDIGSGGGLPGIVVAILAAERSPELKISLIESDSRKCAFLRTIARECGLNIKINTDRIEKFEPQEADVLSARALSDLSTLLNFSTIHLRTGGTCIFPKGGQWKKEVDNARKEWTFDYEAIKSNTNPEAVILKISGVARV